MAEYPIPEYDADPVGIIDPTMISRGDVPGHAVLCFFGDVAAGLAATGARGCFTSERSAAPARGGVPHRGDGGGGAAHGRTLPQRHALCEAPWGEVRKDDSYLGAQFRRFQRRFGQKAEGKAIFA